MLKWTWNECVKIKDCKGYIRHIMTLTLTPLPRQHYLLFLLSALSDDRVDIMLVLLPFSGRGQGLRGPIHASKLSPTKGCAW